MLLNAMIWMTYAQNWAIYYCKLFFIPRLLRNGGCLILNRSRQEFAKNSYAGIPMFFRMPFLTAMKNAIRHGNRPKRPNGKKKIKRLKRAACYRVLQAI